MMDFFLELMTEEMPPSHVKEAVRHLEKTLPVELSTKGLVDKKGKSGRFRVYGTCRRLIVQAEVRDQQPDREEEIIGPPKAAAFSPDGKPTQAAVGFARSKGVSVEDLVIVKTKKGEYIGVKTIVKGRGAGNILASILPKVISSIPFQKMMRWGDNPFQFSRPIKNICCLLDRKKLKFSIAGVSSSDTTYGHALLSPKKIRVKSFLSYVKDLRDNKVIIFPEKRKEKILNQVEKKLAGKDAELFQDDKLFEKLVYDLEWPLVFLGAFPEAYLKLPIEILSTAMKKGQNLFSVVDGRKQLPYFIGVADACYDARGLIRKGNERVLKARLEDARYFWEQDLKMPLKKRAGGLKKVVDQEQLGSYSDKIYRLRKIVQYMAVKLDVMEEKNRLAEASNLCKADLMTEMIREFPSLQGVAGGLYAKEEKYPASIWKAVYEHYMPVGLNDAVPASLNGQILSIADKMDAIIGTVGSGIQVTGSKDPFGIRRNAQGVCRIIIEKKLNMSFPRLVDKVIRVFGDSLKLPGEKIKSYCLKYFINRLNSLFLTKGYRYDLIEAALSPGIDNIYFSYLRIKALDSLKESPQFEPMILIAKRVNNILRGQPGYKVRPELLIEKRERELHTSFLIIKENISPLIVKGEFSRAQKMIFRMRPMIDGFFDHILVMCEDKKLQRNRVALLQAISKLFYQVADYSKVVVSD